MKESSRSSPDSSEAEQTAAGGGLLVRDSVIELDTGSILDDRYQIRRVVGKGATGVVLEADDRVTRSLVAIKVFKKEIATDERWQEIVGSELRHARRLQHPNVCRVFDAGDADGYRFLTMEYAGKGSLRQRLKEHPDRPLADRLADASAVVAGLAAIHAAGVIHRDVKPDNVLCMDDGRLVVTDFGLAVAPGQMTFISGYSGAVGTPHYMAPEVAMGGDASTASDVFALGVVLHEILFGKRPEWTISKRGRFLQSSVGPKATRVERAMAQLCARCLEELAPRRLQNAGEVQERLGRIRAGRTGLLLGSLRAGRWGIAAGLALAAGAGLWAARTAREKPAEDVAAKATLVGEPADWSKTARLLVKRDGPIRCLSPSPDSGKIRALWGEPLEPVEIDVATGHVAPWAIRPETYATSCPVESPTGGRLAFIQGMNPSQVMLSHHRDGRDPRAVSNGFDPKWWPQGKEILFTLDPRRVAYAPFSGTPEFFPESIEQPDFVMDTAVSPTGNRVALLSRGNDRASSIVFYEFPSLKITRRLSIQGARTLAAEFPPGSERLWMILEEGGRRLVAQADHGGRLTRLGHFGEEEPTDLLHASEWHVATRRRITSAFVGQGQGERLVASGSFFEQPSVSAEGGLLLARSFGGGSRIEYYPPGSSSPTPVTSGQDDRSPHFLAGSNRFAYVDRISKQIRICTLSGEQQCQDLDPAGMASYLVATSPDGRGFAYLTRSGALPRLHVYRGSGQAVLDLGRHHSMCPSLWVAPQRLWAFSLKNDFRGWEEIELSTGAATGKRIPIPDAGLSSCAQGFRSLGLPHARLHVAVTSTIWALPARLE